LHDLLETAKFLWRGETPTPCVQAQLRVGSHTVKTGVARTILKEDMNSSPRTMDNKKPGFVVDKQV
jgi:hypothetical protein